MKRYLDSFESIPKLNSSTHDQQHLDPYADDRDQDGMSLPLSLY